MNKYISANSLLIHSEIFEEKREAVSVNVYREEGALRIERMSKSTRESDDAITFAMTFVPKTSSDLRDFFAQDEYAHIAERKIRRVVSACSAICTPSYEYTDTVDALGAIGRLRQCKSEACLLRSVESIVKVLGGDQFVFTLVHLHVETKQAIAYRNLVGIAPGAAQHYMREKWFASEPFLLHAGASCEPIVGSQVGLLQNLTGSWKEMGEFAREYGLGSWLACPIHDGTSLKFGVLRVTSPILPENGGEAILLKSAPLFRALAAEIFEWEIDSQKMQARQLTQLTSSELTVLQAIVRGSKAGDIAEYMGVTPRHLYQKVFRQINEKLKTGNIAESVSLVKVLGLVPILAGQKVVHIVSHERYGVYLGTAFGCPSWSKVNADPELDAFAFQSSLAAEDFVLVLGKDAGYVIVRVEIDQTEASVSMARCISLGIPSWEDAALHCGSPADDSATPGTMGDPPATYH